MLDKLPNEISKKILDNLQLCTKDSNLHLVSKLFYKLVNPSKCKSITVFKKKICYHHNKEIIKILSIDFSHCITQT